jgi:hypothetical protein
VELGLLGVLLALVHSSVSGAVHAGLGAAQKGLEAGKRDNDNGKGHFNHAERVCRELVSAFLWRYMFQERLTNKVLLAGSDLERGEADDSGDDGKGTEAEGDGYTSGLLEYTLSQKNEGNSVANKVASQVERKVEDEGLRGVEYRACAVLLRPLHRNISAAEECVVEEDGQVARDDKSSHAPQHLAHGGLGLEVKEGPVKRQHAELGEAHAEIVEVVGGKRNLRLSAREFYF